MLLLTQTQVSSFLIIQPVERSQASHISAKRWVQASFSNPGLTHPATSVVLRSLDIPIALPCFSKSVRLIIVLFLGFLIPLSARAIEPAPQFPIVSLKELQKNYYSYYEGHKDLFTQALAGKPEAVDAFLDDKRNTDGEHAEVHSMMCQILLAHLGDHVFSRHLASRAPLVQWRLANTLPLVVGPSLREDYPAWADLTVRLRTRYPRTAELAVYWQATPYKEVARLEQRWADQMRERGQKDLRRFLAGLPVAHEAETYFRYCRRFAPTTGPWIIDAMIPDLRAEPDDSKFILYLSLSCYLERLGTEQALRRCLRSKHEADRVWAQEILTEFADHPKALPTTDAPAR